MTFKKEWWVAVHTKAPRMKEEIIYAMVEKLLFGQSKEDDNINYMPFLSLLDEPFDCAYTFDLSKDKSRLETICMQNSITIEECLFLVKEFNDFNSSRGVTHKSFSDAFTHFANWVKKQPTLRTTTTKQPTGHYKFFLDWVANQAPNVYANMEMPTEKEIEDLKSRGISGKIVGEVIRKIENNRVLIKRRKNLYNTILEVYGIT